APVALAASALGAPAPGALTPY
ncbi:hypothetical protein L195_g042950, partial [Trifolium pratense]